MRIGTMLEGLGCLALLFFSLQRLSVATREGVGLSPDSLNYLVLAQNIAAGKGVVLPNSNSTMKPYSHFPPLYPLAIAAGHRIWPDWLKAARQIQIGLYAVNFFLFALLLHILTQGSAGFTLFGAALFATSVDLLEIHSMVWSEPLFLTLGLLGLLCFLGYLNNRYLFNLYLASFFWGLTVLVRYAGLAWIAASLLAVWGVMEGNAVKKLRGMLPLSLLNILPGGLWFLRNRLAVGQATDRTWVYHPVSRSSFGRLGQDTLALWFRNGQKPFSSEISLLLFCFLAIVILVPVMYPPWRRRWLPLVTFNLSYLMLLIAISQTLFDFCLNPVEYSRILCPLHVSMLLTACALLKAFLPARRSLRAVIGILSVCGGISMVYSFNRTASAWATIQSDGQQYAEKRWKESSTLQMARSLPVDRKLYSNIEGLLDVYAGRTSYPLPNKIDATSGRPSLNYAQDMALIRQLLLEHRAFLVYFDEEYAPVDWEDFPPLRVIRKREDGRILTGL